MWFEQARRSGAARVVGIWVEVSSMPNFNYSELCLVKLPNWKAFGPRSWIEPFVRSISNKSSCAATHKKPGHSKSRLPPAAQYLGRGPPCGKCQKARPYPNK
jgi:hypothetical protein